MELRAFAEQVLFSTSLDEKLASPDVITDEEPGAAIEVPDVPGRPVALRFRGQDESRSRFPGEHELEDAANRSRLFHFFANHELLATELMALVLLKFPDAPPAFRRGVLQTLKDEQAHTRMYLRRMRECGMEFGELPVSGYFWASVSPMEHPIDYVSSLCLTFEQANLDYSKHFTDVFKNVGDGVSARLMDKIYRDEIGHVAYGLKWFRRWKNPAQTDWDAFCRQLKFPLSPQRAKGFSINVAGREAAGLERAFIDELAVYSQSRGRTPNIFVFNPTAEGFIANGTEYQPTKQQVQLVRDLENLSQFLCRKDDIVLVREKPRIEFLASIMEAGIDLPEFMELRDGGIPTDSDLFERKINDLKPWAWGPDSLALLADAFALLTGRRVEPEQRFNDSIRELYSKSWSAAFLTRCLEAHGEAAFLGDTSAIGSVARSVDEALRAVQAIRNSGHHKIVIKESVGVAGSNAIRLWEPEILETQLDWIERACARGCELVVEPWLDRVADFSVQLDMTADGLKICGFTGLSNTLQGRFKGNRAESDFRKRIPESALSSFANPRRTEHDLREFYDPVFAKLESELREREFIGPIGVDALVYRDADGRVRVKLVVEINPRYTMGRLTFELMKHVAPGSRGEFRIVNRPDLKRDGFAGFEEFAVAIRKRHPLKRSGQPRSRIEEGAVILTDPQRAKVVLAWFLVTRK